MLGVPMPVWCRHLGHKPSLKVGAGVCVLLHRGFLCCEVFPELRSLPEVETSNVKTREQQQEEEPELLPGRSGK